MPDVLPLTVIVLLWHWGSFAVLITGDPEIELQWGRETSFVWLARKGTAEKIAAFCEYY